IRAHSAILNKTPNAVFGVNCNLAFCTNALFIRTKKARLARVARKVCGAKVCLETQMELTHKWN
ncbi:MAG: hypothetical protein ACTS6J_15380, partial [Burkholderiales bacterium]